MMSDLGMVRFTIRLLGRSMRWVAPAILWAAWVGVVLANPGPTGSNAVATFPVQAIVLCWLAVTIGNIDDDGHRELCTATVGSPSRLLLVRTAAAGALAVMASALAALALIEFSVPRSLSPGAGAATFALQLAGCVAGVGIGSAVHRPTIRHVGVTLIVALAALLVFLTPPPVTHLLREVDGGSTGAAYLLLGIASLVALALVGSASMLTRRFAR